MRIPTLFAVLALAASACSTTYQPKRTDRMYLVLESSKLALRKNGMTTAEDAPFAPMFACDRAAGDTAAVAQVEIKSGYDLAAMSSMLHILVGPGSAIAIILAFQAQSHLDHGHAAMVDALNRHNDAVACRSAS